MTRATTKPVIPAPGSMTWPFKLGDRVRDSLNGIEGIAVNRVYHITGCDRFVVEPDAQDGKPGEAYHVNGERLELVKAYPERHRDEVPDLHVHLGDEVRGIISGLEGTCQVINVPLYGAVQVDISPKWDKENKTMPEGYFIDVHMVEVVKPYTPVPKDTPKKEPTNTGRGATRLGKGML